MPETLRVSELPDSPETVFAWHEQEAAFDRLSPPFDRARMVGRTGGLEVGAQLEIDLGFGMRWLAEHTVYEPPHRFVDVSRKGPFASWEHTHSFDASPTGTRMTDRIVWKAPLGPLGWVAHPFLHQKLDTMFAWRHLRLARDLARHREADLAPMTIAITGASGLVGRALTAFLRTGGHTVIPLSRRPREGAILWDPLGGTVGPGLEKADAVIHLAGAPIAEHAWTEDYKASIRDSRCIGTHTLATALAKLPPKIFISTSAIGVYGDRGDEALDESSSSGEGFLAEVGTGWEAAVAPARDAGWRTAIVRVGLVISARGGLLGPLLPLFRLGGGGPVGSGRQWMSWVHLDDLVALFHRRLVSGEGVYNGTAPHPVRNATFSKTLGRVLWRPAFAPAPAFAVRAVLGREKADELLLSGQRVQPRRAIDEGFRFDEPTLEGALRFELGSSR